MDNARSLWPKGLRELPMNDEHKKQLQAHWANLQKDFRI
jgi:serine/threonine-protein kinase HipA